MEDGGARLGWEVLVVRAGSGAACVEGLLCGPEAPRSQRGRRLSGLREVARTTSAALQFGAPSGRAGAGVGESGDGEVYDSCGPCACEG